ncbi:glycosyl transferase family 1 [Pedobacter sp. Leaf41]|uniref:glycosyltransferase n=1 Tax=Pedobacter sp. Leaf41 TaxID=1736218 RepID=UPI0007037759|nr:glycosyltransferase [Pedobacter sp. Leaf41]KQN34703.1 glycosyl transferase family 1 [Pedobacter sp. Leaf41]
MKNRNIIIVGQQAWDTEIGSNCKNIALEFSKQNRVLYINPALDRISKWRGRNDPKVIKRMEVINGNQSGIEEISSNLITLYPSCLLESINWLPHALFNRINKLNNKRFFHAIKPVIAALNFTNPVLFNDGDMFRSFHLIDLLKPDFSIYYSRDNMLATSYYGKHGTLIEPQLITKNNLCVANSEYLRDYCAKYNFNSHYVGQGCDFDLFDDYLQKQGHQTKISNKKPVIGYVGVLTAARLNIQLIEHIARSRPEWTIELVGPEDDAFKTSKLHDLENVKFWGAQPISDLPKFIDGFDVCFNPQVLNDLTIGNYPRKIDEYLVMGKPTIATKTKSMEAFKDHVFLANNLQEYLTGISELMKNNSASYTTERVNFARSHSWERSVSEIYKACNKTQLL